MGAAAAYSTAQLYEQLKYDLIREYILWERRGKCSPVIGYKTDTLQVTQAQ